MKNPNEGCKSIYVLMADCDEVLLHAFSTRARAEQVRDKIIASGHDKEYVTISERLMDPSYLAFFDLNVGVK